MKRFLSLAASAGLAGLVGLANAAGAQQAATAVQTPFDVGVLMYGSFNYHIDSASRASLGGKAPNQFSIDRVYLNFRMPAGDNGQLRITTDIFQNLVAPGNAYYQGWAIRIKYGFFQYTGLRGTFGEGSSLSGRVGLIQDVAIDQLESSWPRYFQPPPVERNQFFPSSDLGVGGLLTLPNHWGEVYGVVENGSGYTAPERDRFKDYGLRVTILPFARSSSTSGLFKSIALVPWVYKGFVGSNFQAGGAGQVGPGENGAITDAMPRDRWGFYALTKTRRLSAAFEFAQRVDASETGLNTTASPRVMTDSTTRLLAAWVLVRPAEWVKPLERSGIAVILRYDHLTPNLHPTSASYAGTTPGYSYAIAGVSYDLTQRITLALDWQGQTPLGFPPPVGANVRPTPTTSTLFAHWNVAF